MASPDNSSWSRDRWLLRFPWDWPDSAWDIAQIFADHWEDRENEEEPKSEDAGIIRQLKEVLVLYPCMPGQVRDEALEALGTSSSRALVEAVSALLRGN